MIDRNLMALVIADTRKMTDTELSQIRESGLGNGFTALDPHDGFRRDDTLWFGTCSECGEIVTNSWREGIWKHTIYTNKTYHASGALLSSTSHEADYCPKQRGEA